MKKSVTNGFARRMDHVVWKMVDGKGILLNLENGAYFEVDPVGLTIWQMCDGRTKQNQITLRISKVFKADIGRVRKDVNRFMGELKRRRLVEVVSTAVRALAKP